MALSHIMHKVLSLGPKLKYKVTNYTHIIKTKRWHTQNYKISIFPCFWTYSFFKLQTYNNKISDFNCMWKLIPWSLNITQNLMQLSEPPTENKVTVASHRILPNIEGKVDIILSYSEHIGLFPLFLFWVLQL